MHVLDADVLIDVQRGHPPAVAWLASLDELPFVAGFAVMELVQAARSPDEIRATQRLVAPLVRMWPSEAECARACADHGRLRLSTGLGLIDSLIAATARTHGAALCTFNLKHYRAVPDLATVQPYER